MACVLVLGFSMIQTDDQLEDSPFVAIFDSIDNASLQTMSSLTHQPVNELMNRLDSRGLKEHEKDWSVKQISKKNNVQPEIVISTIYQ